jgi:hypothetical protein
MEISSYTEWSGDIRAAIVDSKGTKVQCRTKVQYSDPARIYIPHNDTTPSSRLSVPCSNEG